MKKQSKHAQLTRQEIMDAARTLFVEQGYEGTSVNDIVQKAECSVGAFYGHFKSKQELANILYSEGAMAVQDKIIKQLEPVQDREGLVEALTNSALLLREDPILGFFGGQMHMPGENKNSAFIMNTYIRFSNQLIAKLTRIFPQAKDSVIRNTAGVIQVTLDSYSAPIPVPPQFVDQTQEEIRELFQYLVHMFEIMN